MGDDKPARECGSCTALLDADARFCSFCGTRQDELTTSAGVPNSIPTSSTVAVIPKMPTSANTEGDPRFGPGPLPSLTRGAEGDYQHALRLADCLRDGWEPPGMPHSIRVAPDEKVVETVGAHSTTYTGYTPQKRDGLALIAFGSPLMLAASVAGSIGYNSWRNSQAAQESAMQWRHTDTGTLYLTDQRIVFSGAGGFESIAIQSIQATELEPDGFVIHLMGAPRRKYLVAHPITLLTWVRFLSFDELPERPESSGAQGIGGSS